MTMDVSKSETSKNGGTPMECHGCRKTIKDRFYLLALDVHWHEDCLKCNCCDCRLGEVGQTLFTKANLILCRRDYLRLFGTTGHCAACNKPIPAYEMIMRVKTNTYHLECFACQTCYHRFCVGDRFHLHENKILCEYDFEERKLFANMGQNPPSNLEHLKRQLPPIPTPSGQNVHNTGHHPIQHQQQQQQQQQHQQTQMLGQPMGQHNHVANGQMPGGTPQVNGTAIGIGPTRGGPGDMNNNGLSGPGMGPVKAPPMSMQAPTS